jgi:hypothetical protein
MKKIEIQWANYDDDGAMLEWEPHVVLYVDDEGAEQMAAQANERLLAALKRDAVRVVVVGPVEVATPQIVSAAIDDCISARFPGLRVQLEDIEQRELERRLRKNELAIAKLDKAVGETREMVGDIKSLLLAMQSPAPRPLDPRAGEGPPAHVERRRAAEPAVDLAVDESTEPPALLKVDHASGALVPSVPVLTREGAQKGEQVGAGAAANVRSAGWGVGGPRPKTDFLVMGPDGNFTAMPLPKVGDSLTAPRSDID